MASQSLKTADRHTAALVRQRIERGGERLWQFEDFGDLPFQAVAQTLSRLTRQGKLQRMSKGLYYRPRETAFGPSRPNPAALRQLAKCRYKLFPAGLAAANLLGFTTQNAPRPEVATTARSLPRKLLGGDTIIHTRRPESWNSLGENDAALLDFLRSGGAASELSEAETANRLLELLAEKGRFERLLKVIHTEPPRVRAMLGAAGVELGKSRKALETLRASLNPLTRFDFGMLSGLEHTNDWQAKERRRNETI